MTLADLPTCWRTSVRLVLAALLVVLTAGSALAAFGDGRTPSVLVLHSYGPEYPWTAGMHAAIAAELDKAAIAYRVEYMDSKYSRTTSVNTRLKALYREKYSGLRIDGVLATDNAALLFALRYREELFSQGKIVAAGINYPEQLGKDLGQAAIVVERATCRQTIDQALAQNPGTRRVTIISDVTESGQAILRECMEDLRDLSATIVFTPLSREPYDRIKEHVTRLRQGEIVYLICLFEDSAGRTFEYNEATRELAAAAQVPLYVSWDFQMPSGAVGGEVISASVHGRKGAQLLVDHVKNTSPPNRVDRVEGANRPIYDHQALARFHIPLGSLPPGSEVLNAPQSAFLVNRHTLFTIGGLLIVVVLLCMLLVLNQRKKAVISTKSQALAETEARYRLLFEHSPIPLLEQDLSEVRRYLDQLVASGETDLQRHFEGHPEVVRRCAEMMRIVDVNRATLKIYEADRPEEISRLSQVVLAERQDALRDELLGLWRHGRFESLSENRTLSGRILHVELRGVVAAGYEQSWQKVFVTVIDITEQVNLKNERKEFERQLQQTQKLEAIGSLAGGIAHDFNNLLSPIMGRAELLLVENPGNARLKEHCQGIVDASRRARDLVRQILAFSRQVDQEIKPVSLAEVVHEVIGFIRPTLPATIEVVSRVEDGCPMAMADTTQMSQVIMNLVTNAFHAMEDKGGRLTIELDTATRGIDDGEDQAMRPGRYLRLAIADTGCGMDEETRARIFDPYFTTKPRGKGTGLGLAVVLGILRGYGGEIRVTSEPGMGTTFTLFFPVVELAVEERPVPVAPDEPMPRGNEHILLVDDEKSIADVTRSMLERLGYTVTARISSHDALDAFRSLADRIDLLITDLTMPQMTGLQLYREIKKIRPSVKVIICTGFSEQLDNRTSRSIGIEGFLHKPVIMAELARCVRSVLDA